MAAIAQMTTVVVQETRTAFTIYMFHDMADQTGGESPMAGPRAPSQSQAELAAARFRGLSDEIRGCAILGPQGVLAATGERDTWAGPAAELLGAADAAAGGSGASHAHVATEEGEAYAVRVAGLAMVAVTDRFTLASLVLADMRATLRDLARSADEPMVREAA
jgi:hypothetical protein